MGKKRKVAKRTSWLENMLATHTSLAAARASKRVAARPVRGRMKTEPAGRLLVMAA